MANRSFNPLAALAKEVKFLFARASYTVGVAATGLLNLTADITLAKVALGSAANTGTFTIVVNAAAANPLATVLVTFTGTANAITCTVTPNDGTNNGATPVDLTTANLTELINSGLVAGKTITLTDVGGLRNDQTASGGGATALADGGEGDNVVAIFASGANAYFTMSRTEGVNVGITGITQVSDGRYSVELDDNYFALLFGSVVSEISTENDHTFQIRSESASSGSVDFLLQSSANDNLADGEDVFVMLALKNSSIK